MSEKKVKRKFEQNDSVVNKKKVKFSESFNDEEEDDDEMNGPVDDQLPNDDVPEEEPQPEFKKAFDVKRFRIKLKGTDFISDLRHFLHKANESSKIVRAYIKAGGKPLELVEAISSVDRGNLYHISYIFNAMQMVLIDIMGHTTQHIDSAIQGCKYLLKSYKVLFENLIMSPAQVHKVASLKLLTAIVACDQTMGRDILHSFDMFGNQKTLEILTQHTKFDSNTPGKDSVRTAFIYFVMSFMVEGNIMLIKNLVDRTELINSILPGLIYDDEKLVNLFLNTIHKFILKSIQISKTKKIQLFNLNSVRVLMNLYEWKGRQYFMAMQSKKKKGQTAVVVNETELEMVSNTVHDFMVQLLASRKYGIAFQVLGNRESKKNVIQKKVLHYIHSPWENERKMRLVQEVLKTCPELAGVVIRKAAYDLAPNKKNVNIMKVFDFYTELISLLRPELVRPFSKKINAVEMANLIKDVCLMPELFIQLKTKNVLQSNKFEIRCKSCLLLSTMFGQCNNYLKEILRWDIYNKNDIRKIKFDLINHVFLHCPTVENIMISLHMTLKEQSTEGIDIFEHINHVFDLLIMITESIPSFIEKTSSVLDYLAVLQPIYDLQRDDKRSTQIEHKAVKLILSLEPKSLSPQTNMFDRIMHSFLNVYRYGSSSEQHEVKVVLHKVFENTGLFQNGPMEINLWLEALSILDEDELETVKEYLITAIKNVDMENLEIGNLFEDDHVLDITALYDIIDKGTKGFVDSPIVNKFFLHTLEDSKNLDESDVIQKYLHEVGFHLYYYLPSNKILSKVLPTKCYQLSKKSAHMKFSDLYNALKKNKKDFIGLFGDSESECKIIFNDKEFGVNEFLQNETKVMMCIYIIVNYNLELCREKAYDEQASSTALYYLEKLCSILIQLDKSLNNDQTVVNVDGTVPESMYFKALKYIYVNNFNVLKNFTLKTDNEEGKCFTDFVIQFTVMANKLEAAYMDVLLVNFRNKIVTQIVAEKSDDKLSNLAVVLNTFGLDELNVSTLIEYLISLNPKKIENIHAVLLTTILNRLVKLKKNGFSSDQFQKIIVIIFKLITDNSNTNENKELMNALLQFLNLYYTNIGDVPVEFFESLLISENQNKTKTSLLQLLFERNDDFNDVFFKHLPKLIDRRELMYPMLNVVYYKGLEIDAKLLQPLYNEVRNGLNKMIEKPTKASTIYKENLLASLLLIEKCMPNNECLDSCKKSYKFDSIDLNQIYLLRAIYQKAYHLSKDNTSSAYSSFINCIIQLLELHLGSDSINQQMVKEIGFITYKWINDFKVDKVDFERITSAKYFFNFAKKCLKLGMKLEYTGEQKEIQVENAILLKILAYICDQLFKNNTDAELITTLFDMVLSHSDFLEVALMTEVNEIKTNIMYLLFVLAQKNYAVLQAKTIPLLLGAYQGKLTSCDQYLLALIQMHEQNGISLQEFKPLMWGENAIAHFSLRGTDLRMDLNNEPAILQVMSIVDRETAINSLNCFPHWRKLSVVDQTPTITFETNDNQVIMKRNQVASLYPVTNKLERHSENNEVLNQLDMTACIRKDDYYNKVYDPAFFVPLMISCFAPGVNAQALRPAQNGLLAYTFGALGSADKQMRLAAGCALLRYRDHLESAQFFDKKLWIHLFDCTQNGLADLTAEKCKNKKRKIPKVQFTVSLFLGQTVNIMMDPTDPLYKPLNSFLLIKNTFDFNHVPEFIVLFNNDSVKHTECREFILNIIRNGIKSGLDVNMLIATRVLQQVLASYKSPITTRESSLMILSIVNLAVKIPSTLKNLIQHGVLTWISSVINNLEFFEFDKINAVVNIINNIWYSYSVARNNFTDAPYLCNKLMRILVALCPIISNRLEQNVFVKYINVLVKLTSESETLYSLFSNDNFDHLMNCVKSFIEDYEWNILYAKTNSGNYRSNSIEFSKTIDDNHDKFIITNLLEFTVNWNHKCLKVDN